MKEVKEKNNKQKILMIVLVPVLIVAGVVLGMVVSSKRSEQPLIVFAEKKADVTIPLEEFLINLNPNESKREKFVKMSISLHSTEKKADEVIAQNIAQVRDAVVYVVHKKTEESLFEEKEEAFAMKDELMNRINESLGSSLIDEVYITDILMQ